jgi:hypothetical protein
MASQGVDREFTAAGRGMRACRGGHAIEGRCARNRARRLGGAEIRRGARPAHSSPPNPKPKPQTPPPPPGWNRRTSSSHHRCDPAARGQQRQAAGSHKKRGRARRAAPPLRRGRGRPAAVLQLWVACMNAWTMLPCLPRAAPRPAPRVQALPLPACRRLAGWRVVTKHGGTGVGAKSTNLPAPALCRCVEATAGCCLGACAGRTPAT